jgi:hypothetical protein
VHALRYDGVAFSAGRLAPAACIGPCADTTGWADPDPVARPHKLSAHQSLRDDYVNTCSRHKFRHACHLEYLVRMSGSSNARACCSHYALCLQCAPCALSGTQRHDEQRTWLVEADESGDVGLQVTGQVDLWPTMSVLEATRSLLLHKCGAVGT